MKNRILCVAAVMLLVSAVHAGQSSRLWETIEWTYSNPTCSGNPFDLIASATFSHPASGEQITTQLFYEGTGSNWKLRFTGTRTGAWTFVTTSADSDLNGKTDTIDVQPNPGKAGVTTKYAGGNRWGRRGLDEAFVPQYAMYAAPIHVHQNPGRLDADLENFFGDHGFNGLHTSVMCAWFDITKQTYDEIPSMDPNPDPRTFAALEVMMNKAAEANGMVHIWAWGDEQRRMTPIKWGMNGAVDKRLQRYICARLGPLPNWSMCYGFDLQEWVTGSQMQEWHAYMHQHMGWDHYLGARAPDMTQFYDGLDYASYQQWRPTYDKYVQGIETLFSGQPKFFEDRFRVRVNVYPEKDYDLPMTRRGLYHSTMAGGAANIWGYLIAPAPSDGSSGVYPNKHELLTASRVFRNRFKKEMVRRNDLTGSGAVCLAVPGSFYIFYKENTSSISMNLSGLGAAARAVAIDAIDDYEELPLGTYSPGTHVFNAPRSSDWVVVVGDPVTGPPELPARIDLGRIDGENRLYRVPNGDGNTMVVNQGGRNCRANKTLGTDGYMYFNVVGSYAYQGSRPDVYIAVEFLDSGTATLRLDYDSAGGAYGNGGAVTLTDSGTWRRHTFHVQDAWFGNRQNNGADFRIAGPSTSRFYIDVVEVITDPGPPPPASNPNPGHGATGVSRDAVLSWYASLATSYDVYLGPQGAAEFRGNQPGSSYAPGPLLRLTTYEWSIVCRNDFGDTAGPVWVFMTSPAPLDLDGDGDVDLSDFGLFQVCLSGTGISYPAGCQAADANSDGAVDQIDFASFMECLGGPNQPPQC